MFHNYCFTNLSIPDGKYLLADAGFPTFSTCSFHIMAHDTIFLNEVMHRYSKYHLLLQLIYTLQAHHLRRIIQLTTHQGSEHHWESIQGDQVVIQDLDHPTRIFYGCTGMSISCPHSNSQLYPWKGSHWDCWYITPTWWWHLCWRLWSFGDRVSGAGRERQSQCQMQSDWREYVGWLSESALRV